MKLSAVVVEYKAPEFLRAFLDSWEECAPDWAHLTVVENAPTEQFGGHPAADLYIASEENIGYGRALNKGIAASPAADVYGFFNSDIVLLPDTLEKCVDALLANEDWGILGPYQYDTKGNVTHGGIIGTPSAPQQRGWHRPKSDAYKDVIDDAVMVMGSAFFMKRECWDEICNSEQWQTSFPEAEGAIAPMPRIYYEETTTCYFARHLGWKNVYYGLAECIHHWHATISKTGEGNDFKISQAIFREFCDRWGIEHD